MPQWLDRRLDELAREDVERRFLALSEQPGPSVANAFVKLLGAVYRAACADHDELRDPVAEWRMGGGKLHRARRRTIAPPAEVLPRWRRGLEAGVPAVMRDMVWMGLFTGLREASQRIADRVEALAMGEPRGLRAVPARCEGPDAR